MPEPDVATNLAVDRTRLSYERTMMSWVRTAVSLITFGFSIFKFVQIETENTSRARGLLGSSISLSMLMIVIGLVALFIAALDNRRDLNALKARFPSVPLPASRARILAALVAILGVLALADVIFRL